MTIGQTRLKSCAQTTILQYIVDFLLVGVETSGTLAHELSLAKVLLGVRLFVV